MKPLGRKNYGSIPHLPGSRIGPGDHHVHEGQGEICCSHLRDRHDFVIVTEKLDGSNTGVARIGDEILALGRAGYLAQTSPFEQHQLFAAWVRDNEERFRNALQPGQRIVGEWLAQAHGTRYELIHEPFVVFDLMEGDYRLPYAEIEKLGNRFVLAHVIHRGFSMPVDVGLKAIGKNGFHGAIDPVEGMVWRVERDGEFDFMAKFVRPDKVDGAYLPEISGLDPVWNWKPCV
jgi:hypothetical protein